MKLFGSRPHEWTRAVIGAITGAVTGPWWLFGQISPLAGAIAFVVSGAVGGYLGRRIGRNLGELAAGREAKDWARDGLLIGAISGMAIGAVGGAIAAILLSGTVGSIELWFFQILEYMLQAWIPALAGGLLIGGVTAVGVGRLYHQRYFDVTIINEPDPALEEGTAPVTTENGNLEEQIIIDIPNES